MCSPRTLGPVDARLNGCSFKGSYLRQQLESFHDPYQNSIRHGTACPFACSLPARSCYARSSGRHRSGSRPSGCAWRHRRHGFNRVHRIHGFHGRHGFDGCLGLHRRNRFDRQHGCHRFYRCHWRYRPARQDGRHPGYRSCQVNKRNGLSRLGSGHSCDRSSASSRCLPCNPCQVRPRALQSSRCQMVSSRADARRARGSLRLKV